MTSYFGMFYFPRRSFDRVRKIEADSGSPDEIVVPKGCYRFQLFRETTTGVGTWPDTGTVPTSEPITGFCYAGGRMVMLDEIKGNRLGWSR